MNLVEDVVDFFRRKVTGVILLLLFIGFVNGLDFVSSIFHHFQLSDSSLDYGGITVKITNKGTEAVPVDQISFLLEGDIMETKKKFIFSEVAQYFNKKNIESGDTVELRFPLSSRDFKFSVKTASVGITIVTINNGPADAHIFVSADKFYT